jgi:hypothetical protein
MDQRPRSPRVGIRYTRIVSGPHPGVNEDCELDNARHKWSHNDDGDMEFPKLVGLVSTEGTLSRGDVRVAPVI